MFGADRKPIGFSTDKPDEDDYQIEKAKTAITYSGMIYGLGPGKVSEKLFYLSLLLILFIQYY
jgi:hypothetical protein